MVHDLPSSVVSVTADVYMNCVHDIIIIIMIIIIGGGGGGGTRQQGIGEECVTRNFIICTIHQILSNQKDVIRMG